MPINCLCEILGNAPVPGGVRRMDLKSDAIAASARPGQFVMALCNGASGGGRNYAAKAMLRRPFCVCDADPFSGSFSIMYEVRGEGTRMLAGLPKGEALDVLGPLGNGFDIKEGAESALVGGGIGAFPLLFLAKAIKATGGRADVMLGFRDVEAAKAGEAFSCHASRLRVTTDDGSNGTRGLATDLFDARRGYASAYACGPAPMLKAVQAICADAGFKDAWLCVEERMACGIGACMVCACRASGGGYKRVCADGPVFRCSDIVL